MLRACTFTTHTLLAVLTKLPPCYRRRYARIVAQHRHANTLLHVATHRRAAQVAVREQVAAAHPVATRLLIQQMWWPSLYYKKAGVSYLNLLLERCNVVDVRQQRLAGEGPEEVRCADFVTVHDTVIHQLRVHILDCVGDNASPAGMLLELFQIEHFFGGVKDLQRTVDSAAFATLVSAIVIIVIAGSVPVVYLRTDRSLSFFSSAERAFLTILMADCSTSSSYRHSYTRNSSKRFPWCRYSKVLQDLSVVGAVLVALAPGCSCSRSAAFD
eukprot:TRINITY_DN1100_c3_g1_i2.p1 TRINITY_DN1100_c3_g1~~TRINITY_DN1100_c3_g1_i2.p1  ORF type:complete len:271 (+),score=21.74 TRINITY_DN1100_c3_g1_i2:1732-2544(+)